MVVISLYEGAGWLSMVDISRGLLLATKLHMPRLRPQLVARSYLIERLQQGMEYALTLVSAPAGFGKTTLLAQWVVESGTPVSWLSLEPEDNEPVRFLSYLIAALQAQDPQLGMNVLALLETRQSALLESALAVLTNELVHHETGDFALVLDDFHVITSEAIHGALAFLLDHLPPQMHLVLATRADPPLALARLRARGQLIEIRAADLRLNINETDTFLHAVMGLDLPPDAIATLERHTEGWLAGLQLAALSLQGRRNVAAFLAAFTGSHRFILDYLSEEVLSRQPDAVQSFLLHTSILERLNGSLCDFVTGQQGSQVMLESLDRANLFLVSLDEERNWYRYHHLFAELLRSRLSISQTDLVPQLHHRASVWYEQHNQPVEAVQHALKASNVERVADLVEEYALSLVGQGQTRTLLGWLNALPDALVRARPYLCVVHASVLHLNNHLEEAEARLRDTEEALQAHGPSKNAEMIPGIESLVRANLARFAGDFTTFLMHGHAALKLLPETQLMMRATAVVQVAHTFMASGDVSQAVEQQVKDAIVTARISQYRHVHFRSLTLLAHLQKVQGRLHAASATYEVAGQASPEDVLQVFSASVPYCFGLGDLLREWNRLEEAEGLLLQGLELIKEAKSAYADDVLMGYRTLAHLQQGRGEYKQALATLDTFMRLADARHFVPRMKAMAAEARARILLAQGDEAGALLWAEVSSVSCDETELSYLHEREYLTLARVRIAQGREDPAGAYLPQALHLLARLLEDAEAKGRMGSVLEILILQALSLDALDEQRQALATLERALAFAEPEDYIRLFVDEGILMQALLRKAQARGMAPDYVARLLASFDPQHDLDADAIPPVSANSALVEPLTERELEVLHLLNVGASNGDIARRLVVSVNTVKRHVYNICSKLGVQSRTQALARARKLHLL